MRFPAILATALLLAACGFSSSSTMLFSPAFKQRGDIPTQYTCDGDAVSPPLVIANIPPEAQSLALLVDDPDAPSGDWVHWIVYGIDPVTMQVAAGTVPAGGSEGRNSWGRTGYGAPCPPSGTHRYVFTLFVLDSAMKFEEPPNKETLLSAMEGHVLAEEKLIGLYSRTR